MKIPLVDLASMHAEIAAEVEAGGWYGKGTALLCVLRGEYEPSSHKEGLATASSRTLPSRTICNVVEGEENIDCTSPVTRAKTAGFDPG